MAKAKGILGAIPTAARLLTAKDRQMAGRNAARLIAEQEQIKASEALGRLMEQGYTRTTPTQSDRTRVGGGNIGGPAFPVLGATNPEYAGKAWGVMDAGTASRLKNLTSPETVWTTMLGSSTQLKSNQIVFDRLKRGFLQSMKAGNLSDELAGKINKNLQVTFGEGADIRDPNIWKQADTFANRAALADVMLGQGIPPAKGGVPLGGKKGTIFDGEKILREETEAGLLHPDFGGDAPTFAAGPRMFTLGQETAYRPDLHPAFPTLIEGRDLGMNVRPTPSEIYLPDWHKDFRERSGRAPGYYELAFGIKDEGLPSQALTPAYIKHLESSGFSTPPTGLLPAIGGSALAAGAIMAPEDAQASMPAMDYQPESDIPVDYRDIRRQLADNATRRTLGSPQWPTAMQGLQRPTSIGVRPAVRGFEAPASPALAALADKMGDYNQWAQNAGAIGMMLPEAPTDYVRKMAYQDKQGLLDYAAAALGML
jgi:hypothetical protein